MIKRGLVLRCFGSDQGMNCLCLRNWDGVLVRRSKMIISTKLENSKKKVVNIRKSYLFIIGILLIFIVLRNVDISLAFNILTKIDMQIFLTAFGLQLVNVLLKSEKWRLLVELFGGVYGKARCVRVWLISYAIGVITPGRLGDFTRVIYLRKDIDMSYGKSVATVFVDRILDLIVLFMLACVGVIIFNPLLAPSSGINTIVVIALFAFVTLIVIVLRKDLVSLVLRPFFNSFISEEHKVNIKSNYRDFYKGIRIIVRKNRTMLISSTLTVFSWVIILIASYLIALSININVNFVYFIFIMPVILVVELLPISISGIGTRDAASIILFSMINVTPESAFIFSTLILITNMMFALIGLLLMQIST